MSPMNNRLMRPRVGGGATDADARAYIQAVQTADGQALEPAVVKAIDDFVIGCKADGIWSAIGSACILMGARTLNGILTPLVGTAPSSNAFVGDATDYNRKTGLLGNGSTKWINMNRSTTADSVNSHHIAVYASSMPGTGGFTNLMGGQIRHFGQWNDNSQIYWRSQNSSTVVLGPVVAGFVGMARPNSSTFNVRVGGVNVDDNARAVNDTTASGMAVFAVLSALNVASGFATSRIAFYSAGGTLSLASLDTRVSALYTAIGAASI